MSAKYEKAKEILMRKAKELRVEADKLDMQAMDSLNRAPYIDALLLQNKGEQELAKLCATKDYGAISRHYDSIIDDEKDKKLNMRVQTRLLRLKSLQSEVSAPSSYSGTIVGGHHIINTDSSGEIPTREEVEKILRPLGGQAHEDVFKAATVATFTKEGRTLNPNWWEITKENMIEWSKKG